MNVAISFVLIGVLFCTCKALEYTCTKYDNGSMAITSWVTKDLTAALLQAMNVTGESNGCTSTEIDTVTNGTKLQLVIIVDCGTGYQTFPSNPPNCYVKKTGTKLDVIIVKQKHNVLIGYTDTQYGVSCDCAQSVSAAKAEGIALTGAGLTVGTVTARTDKVEVALYDTAATPALLTGPQPLGKKFKIRVTFTPDAAATGDYPKALQIYNVQASGTSAFEPSNTLTLINDNGCKIVSGATSAFNLQSSFAMSATLSVATFSVSESGEMEVVMFQGAGQKHLFIRVFYRAICLTTTDIRCANQDAHCAATGRKRRGVDDISKSVNGSLTLSFPVYIDGVQSSQGEDLIQYQPECKVPDMYWIISLVLGMMLLTVIVLCVFLALRLRRERGKDNHLYEKRGESNLSYRS